MPTKLKSSNFYQSFCIPFQFQVSTQICFHNREREKETLISVQKKTILLFFFLSFSCSQNLSHFPSFCLLNFKFTLLSLSLSVSLSLFLSSFLSLRHFFFSLLVCIFYFYLSLYISLILFLSLNCCLSLSNSLSLFLSHLLPK